MLHLIILFALGLQSPQADNFAALRDTWAHNLHDKRVEACVAQYAPDAEFIDPTGARVRGTADLRQLFTTITTAFDSDLTFTSVRVEISGDLAYDSGTFRETLIERASGKRLESSGSYLTVYRRSSGADWRIVEQIWTGTPVEVPAQPAGRIPK